MPTIAHIGLGSNVGDRAQTLVDALKALQAAEGVTVRAISHMIETAPVGGPAGQGKYLNAAAEVSTDLTPRELLAVLNGIEHALGRRRPAEDRWGPRTCDLDILLMGDTVMETAELTIPHPRMHERLFVLRPLAQIAPRAVHPVLGKTIAELLAEAEGK
ncbi:MAG TPA: 2-amino-4-hydroxy-6-hydroxymethyldihydropteridine diphosphokinase [Phycisphaerae bacterium]|nr:2-amino-4-hydroxy-6-hydroxymethyldihydropteridine diphosphokinase [Phycisphaerae bacterium]HUU23244.1 2-amino-4-hydroxy-6-hydroxymethyldihydropteridine diphosphokinase [Phycisphaerae bacterium]